MSNIVTTQADELRAFFARVRPCYRELFNMAHAICGNYELAEYAVQSAILDVFRRGSPRSRAGLRETLRAQTRAMAMEQARLIDDAELTWDGFREDAIEGAEGDVVLQAASLEPLENRRMLMLRYGCGLSAHDIARLLDMPAAQVSGVLTRFSRRLKRRLPPRADASPKAPSTTRPQLMSSSTILVTAAGEIPKISDTCFRETGCLAIMTDRMSLRLFSFTELFFKIVHPFL